MLVSLMLDLSDLWTEFQVDGSIVDLGYEIGTISQRSSFDHMLL